MNHLNAKIAIVSSLPKKDIILLSEKISKSLERENIKKRENIVPLKKNNKKNYVYKKINSEQAHIYIGGMSIKRFRKSSSFICGKLYIWGKWF